MCGIAGKINFKNSPVLLPDLKKMSKAIAHRGPDDEGFYISKKRNVSLISRRLAVIDLSARGHQPMRYKNRYVIAFNGEIYNFQEKREKLRHLGYRFKSKSDTEVILALYDKYGTRCLEHLRGMFAFAIYDEVKKTIFIARDRIGKKPLKYFFDGESFIFASELKAILTQKEVKKEPDFLSIHHFLTYGFVPAPLTGFVGIQKLEPGTYLILNTQTKKLVKKKYWEPNFTEKLDLSEGEWCKRIIDTLAESTKLRMISDVPIGAFLSGGVDSSGVVASMATLSPNPIQTFTIGFKEKKYNETKHAERVAKLYKTKHTVLKADTNAVEELPDLVKHFEEPFSDASSVVTNMVSRLARKYVTVILNGDGGDENFTGYDRHFRLRRDVQMDNLGFAKQLLALSFEQAAKVSGAGSLKRASKFFHKAQLPLSHRWVTYNSYFRNDDKKILYKDSFYNDYKDHDSYAIAHNLFTKAKVRDTHDRALFSDLTSYLPEDLLVKVDIASMKNSLEARSPFLDHNMIELAAKIPYHLKVKGSENKYILKKAMEKLVPKENLYREKKGFSVPLDAWFSGKLNKYGRSILLSKNSKTKSFLRQDYIKKMLSEHSPSLDYGPQLWTLLTLELWFRSYFN